MNLSYKINNILSNKCTRAIGNLKKTHAHPLTMARNPVILLRPEDIRARPNHQPTMHSHKNLQVSVIIINGKNNNNTSNSQKKILINYELHRDTIIGYKINII